MYNRIFMTTYSTITFDVSYVIYECYIFVIILVFCITTVVYFVIKLLIHYSWNSTLIIWSSFPRMDFGTVQSVPQLKLPSVHFTLNQVSVFCSDSFFAKVSLPIFGLAGVFVGSSAARFVKTLGHVGHYRHIHRDCCFRQRDRRRTVELPKFSPIRSPEQFYIIYLWNACFFFYTYKTHASSFQFRHLQVKKPLQPLHQIESPSIIVMKGLALSISFESFPMIKTKWLNREHIGVYSRFPKEGAMRSRCEGTKPCHGFLCLWWLFYNCFVAYA